MKFIPHSKPTLGQAEIDSASKVIESSMIAQGAVVTRFEEEFADVFDAGYAAAVNSGTSALHLALLSMGVCKSDEIIIPSYVCTALLNAVEYIGATPVLADINPETGNIDPEDIKKRLSKKTKVIIVPHMFGLSAEMDDILEFDIPVLEDCAQSVGGSYNGEYTGKSGIAAVFSFFATKVITSGEGGMVVSSSDEIIKYVKDMREYDQKDNYKIRYNYKMTDIQAAVGLAQLKRLSSFIERRRLIAEKYNNAFKDLDLKIPDKHPGHIYFRYCINLGSESETWINILRKKGIGCSKPVYLPIHKYLKQNRYDNTDKLWAESISLPIYPSLSENEVDFVIENFVETYMEVNGER
jgi:perosamine synthetase